MNGRERRLTATLIVLTLSATSTAAPRTWTEAGSGRSVSAELVAVQNGIAVLRSSDGTQFTVAVRNLSPADREFIDSLASGGESGNARNETGTIAELTEQFFSALQSDKREALAELVSKKSQELLKGEKSPIAKLPTPDEGRGSIRPGRAKIEDETAVIPVQVRVGKKMHKTKLHFRNEDGNWRVYALTAVKRDGDTMIDFETEATEHSPAASQLDALVGNPFPLVGMTLDGRPIDLSRLRGRTVLVLFWSSTSPQALAEMPNVLANHQKHRKDGLEVVTVSVDQDLSALSRFLQTEKPPWPVIVDNYAGRRDSIAARYGIRDLPALVLVGADGIVVDVNSKGPELGKKLEQIFAVAKKQPATDPQDAKGAKDVKPAD